MIDSPETHIVLTGGPCSGKTSALTYLYDHLSAMNYRVIVVPEAATLVYGATGRRPEDRDNNYEETSQASMVKLQSLMGACLAESVSKDVRPKIFLHDRAELDGRAYLGRKRFDRMLMEINGDTPQTTMRKYQAVIHLVTAAEGEGYTLDNNDARTETPEQARKQDRRTQRAWLGHSHFIVVPNEGDFEQKLTRILRAVLNVLGEPEPLEIEKRWLLSAPPELKTLRAVPVHIRQTYLKPNNNDETVRVRARTVDNHTLYYRTSKTKTDQPSVKIEYEDIISEDAYRLLLGYADPRRREIVKTRWVFTYGGQHFELDHFQSPKDLWILEAELIYAEDWIELPEHVLGPLQDITGNRQYSNRKLALK